AADGGVIGRIVSGRGILDRWIPGDRILSIEPVISWADTSRSFTTSDGSLPLDEGMQIVTHIRISVQGWSPEGIDTTAAKSVEHLLLSLNDGRLHVGRASSTHIRDERRSGEEVPQELNRPRREGAVTVRTRGTSRGAVYVYTADVPSNPGHTLVGQVVHGIELAKLAREGDTLCVGIGPGLLDFRGLAVDQAMKLAEENQVGTELDISAPDDRVVVAQVPETTLEILSAKHVRLATAPLSKVITVALDSIRAPLSVALFRMITGLHSHGIGSLPLFFMYEDVYLFKPAIPRGMQILPENTPSGEVPAGTLAITNDARRGAGLIGVRTRPNNEFGPTSEPFEGTNILGTITDLEKLATASEKDIVYVKELKG
ncbi:MAG: methanogenesis marker 3 protein, partial [Methanoregulaceae archaeon]|nr:methanogenesis marker 3 protein [Methanoregulaceae archaeon]